MEAARVDCVGILQNSPPGKVPIEDMNRLYAIADALRAADKR